MAAWAHLLLASVAVVSAAAAFDVQGGISPDPQAFLQKYALVKLHESCFGRNNMIEEKMKVKAATVKCNAQKSLFEEESEEPAVAAVAPPAAAVNTINRSPYLNQFVAPQYYGAPLAASRTQAAAAQQQQMQYLTAPYFMPYFMDSGLMRGKRQSKPSQEFDEQKFEDLKNEILSKLSNVTCILTEMGMIDKDRQINVVGIKEQISQTDMDIVMKGELNQGVDICSKFATCLPLEEYEDVPIGKDIAPAFMFLNCYKGKKMEACIKKDLRERLLQFIQDGMPPEEAEQILARTKSASSSLPLPKDGQDLDTFVFAMLYEDEPKSFI